MPKKDKKIIEKFSEKTIEKSMDTVTDYVDELLC